MEINAKAVVQKRNSCAKTEQWYKTHCSVFVPLFHIKNGTVVQNQTVSFFLTEKNGTVVQTHTVQLLFRFSL